MNEIEEIKPTHKLVKRFSQTDEHCTLRIPLTRSQSVPDLMDLSKRKIITNYVLLKILEVGLDQNMAKLILDQMDDSEFRDDEENRILGIVLDALMISQSISYVPDQEKSFNHTLRKEFQFILKSPNLMSYIQEEEEKDPLSLQSFECAICYTNFTLNEKVVIQTCQHCFCRLSLCEGLIYLRSCIQSYLRNCIMSSNVLNIRCPQCEIQLTDEFIHQNTTKLLYDKLHKFRKAKLLSENNNIRWCQRPDCEMYIERKQKENTLTCECGWQVCFKCGNTAHKQISCVDAQDQTYKKALKDFLIQKCPNCSSPIQKHSGCNHMTCYHCSYQFCWLCRCTYTSRHYSSYNIFGCPEMQFSERDPFKYPRLYRFCIFIILILLGPPIMVLGSLLAFIGFVLGFPMIIFMFAVSKQKFNDYSKCKKFWVIMGLGIVSILVSPLSLTLILLAIVGAIVSSIPIGIYYFIRWLIGR